jgi:hypothetical protein
LRTVILSAYVALNGGERTRVDITAQGGARRALEELLRSCMGWVAVVHPPPPTGGPYGRYGHIRTPERQAVPVRTASPAASRASGTPST